MEIFEMYHSYLSAKDHNVEVLNIIDLGSMKVKKLRYLLSMTSRKKYKILRLITEGKISVKQLIGHR